MKRVLIALTSHDKKGTPSGEPTGAYLPEIAHPHAVFVAAGYTVDLVSTRGGPVPLDGVDRSDAVSAAFLDDPEKITLSQSPRSGIGSATYVRMPKLGLDRREITALVAFVNGGNAVANRAGSDR